MQILESHTHTHIYIYIYTKVYVLLCTKVTYMGPRHHGMARPQVVDERTASNMEGGCEYNE